MTNSSPWFTTLTNPSHLSFTTEQQTIIDSTEECVLVNAVAGSGKTSVLMEIAKKYNNGLYLAFNKAIVKDVIPKLPLGWSCKTFNAFGLHMVYQNIPKIKVDFTKYSTLFGKGEATHLAQKHMILAGDATTASWEETCRRFTISTAHIEDAKHILKQGMALQNLVSGDEMLEYPIQNGWRSEHYDIVLVDECQDLNPQQIKFLSCIPTNRIIFVGDLNQAIYGFRGSDPFAVEMVKKQYSPTEYPMPESFRCPIEILNEVKDIVPQITSNKSGGSVHTIPKSAAIYPDSCFVTSRTNASLIRLAHKLISKNEHFAISALFVNALTARINPVLAASSTIEEVRDLLEQKYNDELNRYMQMGWNTANLVDRYKGLITIAKNCTSIKGIKAFISNMRLHTVSGSERKLITIHAAKGLEAEHVFFLDPDTCAYFKTKTNIEWEKQQEDNLYYVACTRALKTLTFVR